MKSFTLLNKGLCLDSELKSFRDKFITNPHDFLVPMELCRILLIEDFLLYAKSAFEIVNLY